jgi:hypothetical protein
MVRALQVAVDNSDAGTQGAGEPGSQVPEGEKKKRIRGPNKAPTTFLGGLRQQVEQHRTRNASLLAERDKYRAKLDEVNRQLDELEAPIRAVEAILAQHPELPGTGPGDEESEQPDDSQPAPEQPQTDQQG